MFKLHSVCLLIGHCPNYIYTAVSKLHAMGWVPVQVYVKFSTHYSRIIAHQSTRVKASTFE